MRAITIILFCSALGSAAALDVGQPAPSLNGVTWVKGEAVEPKGAVTIVEFWATWCKPCVKTMPHLSELQKQHGDRLRVVGLTRENEAIVSPFVAKQGDAMAYRVGIASQELYLAYKEGIEVLPYAFLIDAAGTTVWAGDPMKIDRPLRQVLAGTYDLRQAEKLAADEAELESLAQSEDPDLGQAKRIIARILRADPVNLRAINLSIAIAMDEEMPERIREVLTKIPIAQLDAEAANELAWDRAIDPELGTRNLDVALLLIRHAMALEPQNAAYVDTYARILLELGLAQRAFLEQERAVKLDPASTGLAATLDLYKQVLVLQAGVDKPMVVPPTSAPETTLP